MLCPSRTIPPTASPLTISFAAASKRTEKHRGEGVMRNAARLFVLLLLASVLSSPRLPLRAQEVQPQIPLDDRIRIAEAFQLGEELQEQVWKGWSEAPFAVLLALAEFLGAPRPRSLSPRSVSRRERTAPSPLDVLDDGPPTKNSTLMFRRSTEAGARLRASSGSSLPHWQHAVKTR